MHFTERLNKLIEDLGADTKTIAAFAGFDRSQLSRLRRDFICFRITITALVSSVPSSVHLPTHLPWRSKKEFETGCLREQRKSRAARNPEENLPDGRERAGYE